MTHIIALITAEGDVRLVDNGNVQTLAGIVQIYHNDQFYHICDDGFSTAEAQVLVLY